MPTETSTNALIMFLTALIVMYRKHQKINPALVSKLPFDKVNNACVSSSEVQQATTALTPKLFIAAVSIQVASLWVFLYTNYPTIGGRSDYYTPLSVSALVTTLCASMAITNKSSTKSTKLVWIYTIMLLLMLTLVKSESLKVSALIYELFMLLSVAALHYSATSEKSKKVIKDFVIWTQFGSLCLLLGLLGMSYDSDITHFYQVKGLWEAEGHASLYSWLILIGILIKVPVVPLHYWITKVHVEASTSFSIFLSGFLVKTASVILFKISPMLTDTQTFITVWLLVLSVFFSTFMLFGESDLKRFVAIGTVQEMGAATLLLVLTKADNSSLAGNALMLHSLISIVMFWLSDQIYCRLGHRSLNGTGGLWYIAPKTTINLLVILTLIRGLPLMFRYNIEIQGFEMLLNSDFAVAIILIWLLAVVGNVVVVYRVFKLFFCAPNRKLMPFETQLAEYAVPILPILALIYFPLI